MPYRSKISIANQKRSRNYRENVKKDKELNITTVKNGNLRNKKKMDKVRASKHNILMKQFSEKQRRNQLLRLARMIRNKHVNSSAMPIQTSSTRLSAIQSLALMSTTRVSRKAHRIYARTTNIMATEYQMRKEKQKLAREVEYKIVNNKFVILTDIERSLRYRLSLLDPNEKSRILLLGDKGHKITKICLMFPDRRTKVQSPHNQLILALWEGNDDHTNLSFCKEMYQIIERVNIPIFIGGDLSFLCSLYGMSNSSTHPCVWCEYEADKSRKVSIYPHLIDTKVYPKRTIMSIDALLQLNSAQPRERKGIFRPYIWSSEPCQCVPPVLHLKLGIGNEIYSAMKKVTEQLNFQESTKFLELSSKLGFTKSFKSDDLSGPKLRKLCEHRQSFRNITNNPRYLQICDCLDSFSLFSENISSLCTNMNDAEIKKILDSSQHLLSFLESTQIAVRKTKCHVLFAHVSEFLKRNRCLGNMGEEGLENLHSIFENLSIKIKRGDKLQTLLHAAKQHAVDVLLADQGLLQ